MVGFMMVLIFVLLMRVVFLERKFRKFWQEQEQQEREKEESERKEHIYSAMLPVRLLELFHRTELQKIQIGDEKTVRAAVLSFNMNDFSQMARSRTTEEIFSFVNQVLGQVVPGVLFQGGEIERYVGAGFRAFYLEEPERALKSAVSVCEAMNQNRNPEQKYSIGLSCGNVMTGIVGDEKRFGVLTISDTTGVAEFLQEMAGRYGARILITGSLREQISDFDKKYNSRYLGWVRLKMTGTMEDIYDVYDGDEPEDRNGKRRTRLLFEKGVKLFQERRFYDARLHFIEVLKANRMDRAAKEYLYLCNRYYIEKEKDSPVYLETY